MVSCTQINKLIIGEDKMSNYLDNLVKCFSNSTLGVNLTTILIDDEPWFIAKEVASILNYVNTKQAISDNVNELDQKMLSYGECKELFKDIINTKTDVEEGDFKGIPQIPLKDTISISNFGMKLINEAGLYAHTIIFHVQGEPLLHPHLPEMIRYAHDHKLFTMLSTNAQLLTPAIAEALIEAGLDRIIVSIDGLTEQTYSHYRVGGNLERALAGMRSLADCKKKKGFGPEIVMQCLYLKSNQHEWSTFIKHYHLFGADKISMKTAQFYEFEHGNPDMPDDSRYSRYKRNIDGSYQLKKKLRNRCYRLWSGCVITTDGTILPCCFDKDHLFPLGNLGTSSIDEIMHSDAAQQFRQRLISNRASISMCSNCI